MASQIWLQPLVVLWITGFALGYFGMAGGEVPNKIADPGITILLFSVGLKLDMHAPIRPQIWAVTALQSATVTVVAGMRVFWSAALGLNGRCREKQPLASVAPVDRSAGQSRR